MLPGETGVPSGEGRWIGSIEWDKVGWEAYEFEPGAETPDWGWCEFGFGSTGGAWITTIGLTGLGVVVEVVLAEGNTDEGRTWYVFVSSDRRNGGRAKFRWHDF